MPTDTATVQATEPRNPASGLTAFLRRWEMNDFLFLLVVENLKPTTATEAAQQAWFAITPDPWRAEMLAFAGHWLPAEPSRAAFLLARVLTTAVFLAILIALVWRVRKSSDPADWLRVGFLILAWFWLLSPTQNPWYWTWALPLVMFARSRAWLAVSGLVMVYYLRFWLTAHWPEQGVAGTSYSGAAYFDLVVTWFEYGPWLLCLLGEAVCRGRSDRGLPPR